MSTPPKPHQTNEHRKPAGSALVGREVEVEALEERLASLGSGAAEFIQISGEPGIGKTRLLEELRAIARREGLRVIEGRASEFEQEVPLALWQDAVAEPAAQEAKEPYRAELAKVFPALADNGAMPAASLAAGAERYRLHRAFGALLSDLAGADGLVLTLDDVHWADSSSIEVLLHLLERPPQGRVLVAVGYRPRQLESSLAAALEDTAYRAGARVELGPLTSAAAGALLPPGLPAARRQRLWELSGGNPFYLEQLVRTGIDDGDGDRGPAPHGSEVPPAVAAATKRELAAVPDRARRLLEGAAVVGDPFTLDLAAVAAEISTAEAPALLDGLATRDIVRVAGEGPGRMRFRHALVHHAVSEATSPGWQIGAHERVAHELKQRGAPATVRARHVVAYAGAGNGEAIDVLAEAADMAAQHAPLRAAEWRENALALLPSGPEHLDRRKLLLSGAGIAFGLAGRLQQSSDTFRTLLDLLPADAPERPLAVRFSALADHLLGNNERAELLVRRQFDALPPGSPVAAELAVELAYGGFITADWEAVTHWASRALEGDLRGSQRAAGLSLRALGKYASGDSIAALSSADAARELIDGLENLELLERIEAISVLAWAELCLEQTDRSLAHADRGLAISEEFGQEHLKAALQVVQALGLLSKGAFARAGEVAQDAIEATRLSNNNLFLTWALTVRCDVEIQSGDIEAAVHWGEQAQQTAKDSSSPWATVAAPYLAEAYLEARDPDRCLDITLDAAGEPRLPPFPFYAPRLYEVLTRAALARGRRDDAARWAGQARESGDSIGLPVAQSVGLRAQAEYELAAGEKESAQQAASEAADMADMAGVTLAGARSRLLAGQAAAATDKPAAIRLLRRAQTELEERGAIRYSDRATRELHRIGRSTPRVRRSPAANRSVEALSPRQIEIAEGVARGLTNPEIGHELGLEPKTVTNHLSRIYRTLELNSRDELAELVERDRGRNTSERA